MRSGTIQKLMLAIGFATAIAAPSLAANFNYVTPGFETSEGWAIGDYNGQQPNYSYSQAGVDTWAEIVAAPAGTPSFLGAQSARLYNDPNGGAGPPVGSSNHSGVFAGVNFPASTPVGDTQPNTTWSTSFFYRTPDTFLAAAVGQNILQMDPAAGDTVNGTRAAYFAVTPLVAGVNGVGKARFRSYDYNVPNFLPVKDGAAADVLFDAGTWYRIDMNIATFSGGENVTLANDTFDISVYDVGGTLLGTVSSHTWENQGQTGDITKLYFLSNGTGDIAGQTLGFVDNPLAAVPEPGSIGLLVGAAAMLFGRRSRRSIA